MDNKTGEQNKLVILNGCCLRNAPRGDTSDNVFSAYPWCPKKGSKNKVGMLEAFADKESKGFNWNNFMLQRWTDHNGEEHRVLDDYPSQQDIDRFNRTAQMIFKEVLDEAITKQVQKVPQPK